MLIEFLGSKEVVRRSNKDDLSRCLEQQMLLEQQYLWAPKRKSPAGNSEYTSGAKLLILCVHLARAINGTEARPRLGLGGARVHLHSACVAIPRIILITVSNTYIYEQFIISKLCFKNL